MRIAFLAYRGNMISGGQGIYLHALTHELAQRGYDIDCYVGPPYPAPMPWVRVIRIENQQFWGSRFAKARSAFLPRPDPFRIFRPLNFYEYVVSRFGFLPEPFAFSVRAARAVIERVRQGVRYDLVHDIQSVSYGIFLIGVRYRLRYTPIKMASHDFLDMENILGIASTRVYLARPSAQEGISSEFG